MTFKHKKLGALGAVAACLIWVVNSAALGQEAGNSTTYLADKQPESGARFMAQSCVIEGKTYTRSLSLEPGGLQYLVPKGTKSFVALVGFQDGFHRFTANATFSLLGKAGPQGVFKVLDTKALRPGQTHHITVPVSDLTQIRLETDCPGLTDNPGGFRVLWWGDARFVRDQDDAGGKLLPDIEGYLRTLAQRLKPLTSGDEKSTVAVVPFDLVSGTAEALAPANASNVCTDFQIALINTRAYRVTAFGDQLLTIMRQNGIQLGKIYAKDTRAELGKFLGAKNLVMGEISDRDDGGVVITASMIDLESGLYSHDEQLALPPIKSGPSQRRTIVNPKTIANPGGAINEVIKDTKEKLENLIPGFGNVFHGRKNKENDSNKTPLSYDKGSSSTSGAPRLLPFLRAAMMTLAEQFKQEAESDKDFSREKPVVALATFKIVQSPNNPLASMNARNTTTDFRVALHNTGRFRIAAPGEVLDTVLQRQNQELGREFDQATRTELGEKTSAKYLIAGEISDRNKGDYAVSIYLHDLTTGEIRIAKKVLVNQKQK